MDYKMDIFQDTIFKDLEKLNFSINESKAYLALIKLGPSLAGRIAKEASLDRSSTYNALKALIERGVISTVYESKRTLYIPTEPKKILDYFQEKEEIARKIIPELQKQFAFKKQKSSVLLFQGYKGLKTIFQDILDNCDKRNELLVMGSEGKFSERMPYYFPIFQSKKEEKKIKTLMLIREGRERKKRSKYTQIRNIPCNAISPATINIYNGKVAFLIWDDNPKGILLENESLSKTFKNYFGFMWKNAKKEK